MHGGRAHRRRGPHGQPLLRHVRRAFLPRALHGHHPYAQRLHVRPRRVHEPRKARLLELSARLFRLLLATLLPTRLSPAFQSHYPAMASDRG